MKPLISVSALSFGYPNNPVLENISLDIRAKDFIALIGPNGSGKTTLVKILLGLLHPTDGTVSRSIPTQRIGYVPQRYTIDKNFPGTVEEILSGDEKTARQTSVESLMKRKFTLLSGGQQQRVLIALALQQNPALLILDEPTAGVDVQAQQSFYSLLKKLNKDGVTIILVTHEVGMISTLVKTVICINHRICCIGETRELPELMKQMYGSHYAPHHHIEHPHAGHHDHAHGDHHV